LAGETIDILVAMWQRLEGKGLEEKDDGYTLRGATPEERI